VQFELSYQELELLESIVEITSDLLAMDEAVFARAGKLLDRGRKFDTVKFEEESPRSQMVSA
jgi:hypothetical protein